MAESMREAFFKTEDGKEFVAQNNPREIARRIRELKDLVHSTFVTNVPEDADLYDRTERRRLNRI